MAGVMLPKILLKEMAQWSGFNGRGHAAQDPVERDVTVVRLLWQGVMLPKILLKEMSQWSGFYGKCHAAQDPVERDVTVVRL